MIFQRAVQREFTQTAAAVFVVLFAILLTTQLIRLLGQAAGGRIASEAVAAILGFSTLKLLPVLLSLTLFISVLLSLSRAYRDSEMVIWFSAGVPLTAWIRPVLRFAMPVVLVIAVLAFFLSPWAQTKRSEYQVRMDKREDVARVTPGAFKESSQGDRVFFVESVTDAENNASDHVRNVFVSSMQQGRLGVMAAAQGHVEIAPNGDKFMVLSQGRRYEMVAGSREYRAMEFARYAIRVETAEAQGIEKTVKNLPTIELLRQPTQQNLAELQWRIGIPVSALLLTLMAIPLSYVNPRASRTNNLLLALLTFMIYSNLLAVSQNWVSRGELSFGVGVWLVHLAVCLIMAALFWKRMSVHPVLRR